MTPKRALNSRQEQVRRRVFTRPTPSDIRWSEVVNMLEALGYSIKPAKGSRYRIASVSGVSMIAHRPHPGNTCNKVLVVRIRRFMEESGD